MPTLTADRRRDQAKKEFDAFFASCPSRKVLDRLSDKWVTLVLVALGEHDLRYSELARRIAGVSPKMLTQTLRSLERDGLVTRAVTPTVPVTVDYALTDLGRSLLVVVGKVKDWAEANLHQVEAAREDYDNRDV